MQSITFTTLPLRHQRSQHAPLSKCPASPSDVAGIEAGDPIAVGQTNPKMPRQEGLDKRGEYLLFGLLGFVING